MRLSISSRSLVINTFDKKLIKSCHKKIQRKSPKWEHDSVFGIKVTNKEDKLRSKDAK